jgi:hypothetical protein
VYTTKVITTTSCAPTVTSMSLHIFFLVCITLTPNRLPERPS